MHDFRRADKAVTREGQVKSRDRHEKDDRRRIDDRREYVLGWTNERKIEALVEHATRAAASRARRSAKRSSIWKRAERRLPSSSSSSPSSPSGDDWTTFDWEGDVRRIAELEARLSESAPDSDVLRTLTAEQTHVASEIARTGDLVERSARTSRRAPGSERRQVEHRIDEPLQGPCDDDADVGSEIASRASTRLCRPSSAADLSASRRDRAQTSQQSLPRREHRRAGPAWEVRPADRERTCGVPDRYPAAKSPSSMTRWSRAPSTASCTTGSRTTTCHASKTSSSG